LRSVDRTSDIDADPTLSGPFQRMEAAGKKKIRKRYSETRSPIKIQFPVGTGKSVDDAAVNILECSCINKVTGDQFSPRFLELGKKAGRDGSQLERGIT
jgi:hypothetical protein